MRKIRYSLWFVIAADPVFFGSERFGGQWGTLQKVLLCWGDVPSLTLPGHASGDSRV